MRKCRVCNTAIDVKTRNHNAVTCSDTCTAAKSKKMTRQQYLDEQVQDDVEMRLMESCLDYVE